MTNEKKESEAGGGGAAEVKGAAAEETGDLCEGRTEEKGEASPSANPVEAQ
jgi:hypothetical protein